MNDWAITYSNIKRTLQNFSNKLHRLFKKKKNTLKSSNLGGPILYGYYSSPAR